MAFLPVSQNDMEKLGWDYVDFVYVSGDAYVDHPSFGVAIISRVLEARGYRVAILPQPEINSIGNYSVPPESHNNLVVFQRFYAEY